MQVKDFFNNITAGATSVQFVVNDREPMTIAARGLAGVETVDLQVVVNGTGTDVYEDGTQVQLTATNNVIAIRVPGVYQLVASATAGALFVEGTISGV